MCADPERDHYCCQPIETERVDIQCTGYTLPVQRVISCGCGECAPVPSYVSGTIVHSDTGEPLQYVIVFYKREAVALSDGEGKFRLTVEDQANKISITLRDEYIARVVDTVKVIQIQSGLTVYCVIRMKPKPTPVIVESSEETYIPVASDSEDDAFAELIIESNTIYDMEGNLYNGKVQVAVNNIDLRNASNVDLAPGDFTAVDENGDSQNLRTFNIWSMETRDEDGNPLAIGGSSMVVLDQAMLPPCQFDENGNCDIKLWILSSETGSWEIASELKPSSEGGKRRKRQGVGSYLIGNVDVYANARYNIDKVISAGSRCWAKVVSYDSEELVTPLSGSFTVNTVIQNTVRARMLQPRSTTGSAGSGVCIQIGCDEEFTRRYSVRMTATYKNQYLCPVDSNSRNLPTTFRLSDSDVRNLDYEIEEGDANSAIKLRPLRRYSNRNGPIYQDVAQCITADVNNANTKYFQFFMESPSTNSPSDCCCQAAESSAPTIAKRSYITFYNNLPEDRNKQKYCFLGIRIFTKYRNVRLNVSSFISSPESLRGLPSQNSKRDFKGYKYGERLVITDPVNGVIDTCMEFKCAGELFTGLDVNGNDNTKVTIEVDGVRGRCSVKPTPPLKEYIELYPNRACHTKGYNTPFCFTDPNTYGPAMGIFLKRNEEIETGSCSGDNNSPQDIMVGSCTEANADDYVPALEITC